MKIQIKYSTTFNKSEEQHDAKANAELQTKWTKTTGKAFEESINLSMPTGYVMHQQCTLCPHCIYVFCIYLRINSDLCYLQHKLIGFYNRDEKCLQRGTDWVFE